MRGIRLVTVAVALTAILGVAAAVRFDIKDAGGVCVTQPAGPPSLIAGSIYSMDSAGLHYIPLTLTVTDPSGHIISQGNPEYVAFEEWLDDIPATTKGDYKFCIEVASSYLGRNPYPYPVAFDLSLTTFKPRDSPFAAPDSKPVAADVDLHKAISDIMVKMDHVKRESTFLATRWRRHSANNKALESRLLWGTAFRCLVVIGCQVFQVYFVRSMFKNKGFSGILGEMSNDIAAMRNARQVAAAMAGPVLSKMGGPAFAPVARAPSFGPPGAPTGYGTYGGVASQPEPAWSGAPAQPAALPWSHSSGEHAAVGPAYGATPALGGGVEPQDRVMPEAEATAFGSRVPHGGMVHKRGTPTTGHFQGQGAYGGPQPTGGPGYVGDGMPLPARVPSGGATTWQAPAGAGWGAGQRGPY